MSVQRVLVRASTHWPQGICATNYRGLGTQRSDDSVRNNPEHFKRRICLTPAKLRSRSLRLPNRDLKLKQETE